MFPAIKKFAYAAVLGAGLSLLVPPAALAQDPDHHDQQFQEHRDWSSNRYYQMGSREGDRDHTRNHRRSHRHKFRSEDDRQAYQAGYESRWQGEQRHDNDQNRPH